MGLTTKRLTITAEHLTEFERVDRAVQSLCGLSRKQIAGMFDRGCVTVNGAVCSQTFRRLEEGDRIELAFDACRKYTPRNKPRGELGFDIVYEDAQLLVVNKPANLLTVPTLRGETNTLLDKVTRYVRYIAGGKQAFAAHRLDRGVSGLLVFGKTLEISQKIRDQFAAHKPRREYVAIVAGNMEQTEGTFRSLLATDRDLNRFSTEDESIGQLAITHYRVRQRLGDSTIVSVRLETGRRNQIRVHFAEAGHPVIGDPRYETEIAWHKRWPYKRLALHARELGFEHPTTGKALDFQVELPNEMKQFLLGAKRRPSS